MTLNSTPPEFRHGAKALKTGFKFASLAQQLVYRGKNSPCVKEKYRNGSCNDTELITFLQISEIPLLTKLKRNHLQLIIRQTGQSITTK